jgi:hypothetical protein
LENQAVKSKMRILVSNDDGVDAAGIRMLASVLREAGHEVTVVAPDRDRSGASNSLTLDLPIRLKRIDHYTVSVAGTPTDCVHLALTGLLEFEPDIVVSGINNAANLGDDVIYSGTVSAAMEGRFLGLPAVAVSLVSRNHDPKHFETAARRGGDRRPAQGRSAAGRHHPQRQRAGPAVERGQGLRGHPPGQPPSRRRLHRAEGSARQRGVLDRPGRS